MTHEQHCNPAYSLPINGANPIDAPDQHQHAPVETKPIMSSHGLLENYYFSDHRLSGEWVMQDDRSDDRLDENESEWVDMAVKESTTTVERLLCVRDSSYTNHRPTKRPRTHFYDFAAQARLQQDYERRKQFLHARKRVLQRSVALSARLQRTSSWVQDGLVEISKQQDPKAFAQVFSHAQDLVDICYSHWTNELNSLDIIQSYGESSHENPAPKPFFDQLTSHAQRDLLDLLTNLRSNPQYLIARLRNLPQSQAATFTSKARWQFSDAFVKSFSQDSNRSGTQRRRLQAFSKELEDDAISFERSNPLSFLLHNLYSYDVSPQSLESQLRLYNWSTICAELLQCRAPSYNSLYGQVLEAFSTMQDWPAKPRIELFLMDVLQRGAFLINDNPLNRFQPGYNPLNTEAAKKFFDEAVLDLWWTLIECKRGLYPTGAVDLAQAIIGKLSTQQQQSDFRDHFFSEWYLRHFLRTAIMFPENENMLLKMHVSKQARDFILAPIFNRFLYTFEHHHTNHATRRDVVIRNIIEDMLEFLTGVPVDNPYQAQNDIELRPPSPSTTQDGKVLVICASEVIKVLQTLSPQSIHSTYSSGPMADEFTETISAALRDSHPTLSTRSDFLKQQLLELIEPGTLPKDIHPCVETWTDLCIGTDGSVQALEPLGHSVDLASSFGDQQLNLPQKAALRLCAGLFANEDEFDPILTTPWREKTSLLELFQRQMDYCQASTRTVDSFYWKRALEALKGMHQQFALQEGCPDDSIVLNQPLKMILAFCVKIREQSSVFEDQIGPYETAYQNLKKKVKNFMSGLEELRLKIWYTSQVIHSEPYQDARNVASALNHMALPMLQMTTRLTKSFLDHVRPTTNRSSRSSIFGEPQSSTMKLLKAPTEYGGPRKLADEQIEQIKRWLQQYNIDNFCKGEERLHRFCMEIQSITKKLTAETMNQSPELWSSELFARERLAYEIHNAKSNSAPPSTRPASVYSESSSTWIPVLRPSESDVRSIMSDEKGSIRRGSYYGLFQRALRPELLTPDLASSLGSYGRVSSASTTTSDGIFSLPLRSVTSVSTSSRAPSILNGGLPNFGTRPAVAEKEMKKFRQQLQKGLVCLLLSDLGSLVWSWGCETDKWIGDVQAEPNVRDRLQKRMLTHSLLIDEQRPNMESSRRHSTTEIPQQSNIDSSAMSPVTGTDTSLQSSDADRTYFLALGDILIRLSRQVDPIKKLDACVEFYNLAIEQMEAMLEEQDTTKSSQPPRRKSLDSGAEGIEDKPKPSTVRSSLTENLKRFEKQIIQHLLRQLARLKPTTIFRDLQFVAVFAPPELLEDKSVGKAFMDLGMAAIEYKSLLCNSMVDVTHRMIAADAEKRQVMYFNEQPLVKAAEYWSIAAREGNRVAQRELALLYLVHPEVLPIVSLPLSLSADIFKEEKMWQKKVTNNDSRQALCLALHWMQQAEKNGDEIAHQKLQERNGQGFSIR